MIVAVLVVLGGGVLLFATDGDEGTNQTVGSTVTETARGGRAQIALAPEKADGKGLPAAPQVSDDALTGPRRSTTVRGETGQDATPAPADAPLVAAALEDDDEIERRPLAGPQEEDTIERRPLAPRTAAVEQQESQAITADGAEAPTVARRAPTQTVARAPAEAVAEAPTEPRQALVADGDGRDEGAPVAALEVVKAPQPRQALATPAESDEGAPVAASEVVKAPQPRQALAAPAESDEGAPVAASEVVKAPQPRQALAAPAESDEGARHAPPLEADGRGVTVRAIESRRLDAPARTVAGQVLPGVRGIEARTGRRLGTTAQPGRTIAAAAGPATIEETRAERTVVAALEPGAPARRVAPSAAEGVGPTFDVVRISATGNAVIAGRAEPGANVVVLDRGTALGQVKANRLGEWVLVPLKPLPPGATELYVEASLPGGSPRQSEDVVVLSVPQRSVSQAARLGPLVVLTPRGGGATRVLQASKRPVARDKGGPGVSLDVVDYDDAGNIVLSGRADANAEVRVYTDNRLIGTARSDKKGDWQLKPDARITPGDHELRVDSVSVDGKVVARIVLPFSRADLQSFDLRDGKVVVQPGNSLWRIARATYGSGFQYTLIFDANREQIDDPDLIFPGQVFKLPESN